MVAAIEHPALLLAPTPERWFDVACERWRELLVDHANCEKKAASTALSLVFTYAEDVRLADRMSRLAREELRHFEQVLQMMQQLQVKVIRMSPSRYADGLRRALNNKEPARLLDLLACGALIEARSCERFEKLGHRLPTPLGEFYRNLARAEARHQSLYLQLAEQRFARHEHLNWRASLKRLAEVEADLASSPDAQFRFHSGEPL